MCLMLPVRSFATPTDRAPRSPALTFLEVPQAEEEQASGISSTAFAVAENMEFTADAIAGSDVVALAVGTLPTDATELPNETPPGTKVPEPASLMLIGSGLLAITRASRMKRSGRKLSCAAPIAMECAVPGKALTRQAA